MRAKITRGVPQTLPHDRVEFDRRVRQIAHALQDAATQGEAVAQLPRRGFTAADRADDQRRAERPKKGRRPHPGPGQMMHEIERLLAVQRLGRRGALRAAITDCRSVPSSVLCLVAAAKWRLPGIPSGSPAAPGCCCVAARIAVRWAEETRTVASWPSRATSDVQFHPQLCSEPRFGAHA